MIALLSGVLGFLGSLVPEAFKLYKDKQDKKHELTVMQLQMQREEKGHQYRLEEIGIQADIQSEEIAKKEEKVTLTGVKWVDAFMAVYNSSVRPTITYAFFLMYGIVKIANYNILSRTSDLTKSDIINAMWSDEDMAIFCVIVGYWFGQRAMKHFFGKKGTP